MSSGVPCSTGLRRDAKTFSQDSWGQESKGRVGIYGMNDKGSFTGDKIRPRRSYPVSLPDRRPLNPSLRRNRTGLRIASVASPLARPGRETSDFHCKSSCKSRSRFDGPGGLP